ncbi:IclR family transcriptional regulator [Rhodococcus sp. TAF43]|uniref:IclR family transcriptional regulator n=1 Tax=unclassified Rhodococcus (in: high G+C Gram-positive bacteria) TaxID=192944 RepID=UPI0015818C0B|nr:IclR family transcriptional regulator [Rhodococcus sp. W8901]QKT13376.1 IclR family transcriptional regulator [Rhodococcus sp. W8901]
MQKKPSTTKASTTITRPPYALGSVDNALRLLQMLRDVGALRLKEAAEELGTAPSTAHRLLAMLMYRGFAVQDEQRVYHPGPAMGVGPAQHGWTRELTDVCRPHLDALAELSGETVNLLVRVGSQVRFLYSAETDSTLRVGDRQGQVLPAERTAGGRILLAELSPETLEQLYLRQPEEPDVDPMSTPGYDVDRRLERGAFQIFRTELEAARAVGFAVNVEQTEAGVAAFGLALRNGRGQAIAALTAAVPTARYRQHVDGRLVAQLRSTVRDIEVEIAHVG